MRRLAIVTATLLAGMMSAHAKISITVDKDAQQMTVSQDGVTRYTWPVSTGLPSYETPNGAFKTFRMEEDHYSKEFDEAPMPHAIFFTTKGHAIHGTDASGKLGNPASHGCVRLSRANASTLFAMVKADGVLNTTVTLTGSSQVALARGPRGTRQAAGRDDVAAPIDPSANDGTLGRANGRTLYAPGRPVRSYDGEVYADGESAYVQRGRRSLFGVPSPAYAPGYGGSGYYVDRGYVAPRGYARRGYYED